MIKTPLTVYTIQWRSGSVTALGAFHEMPNQFKALSWFYDTHDHSVVMGKFLLERLGEHRKLQQRGWEFVE